MRQKTKTIQDIARIAGVSTATVSRALSAPAQVSESTRERVMLAVRQTGYQVNHTARNLRRQRSGSILALVPNLANPFFSQILSGLAEVVAAEGYGLLIADTQTDPDPAARLFSYLDNRMADGLVLFDGRLADQRLAARPRVPVILACEWGDPALPSVRVNNAEGAALAVRHLVANGHRAIGLITGPAGNVLTESRLDGTRKAMTDAGLALRPDWTFPGDFTLAAGVDAAQRWMALDDRPTAVLCASDEMACGFIGALQHAGHSVPDAVSVIGFDDIEVCGHLTPALTTIRQPRKEIGERAAELLVGMIAAQSLACTSQMIDVELIPRDSVRRLA
ncbi:substrate-binding domain-containing protein [Szabonella alba]|uniref:LacI family DNA-binding transcriptional regulator n=1 Tax=Szabonella alba TaxID=2804194 RepID=A0A8K0Y1V5_9RHOB|nr:LacI family DNA-binding transcriptional regulator [Szabonella alba]